MNLIRYQTTPLLNRNCTNGLQNDIDRLFDLAVPFFQPYQQATRQFPVELDQDKEAYYVRVAVPGLGREDLQIDVVEGHLNIALRQKTETKAETTTETKTEATPVAEQKVRASITLPDHVDVNKIQAKCDKGLLTVTLPKAESVKLRHIEIQ